MSSPASATVVAQDLQGFKYLNRVLPLLRRLHPCGTASDRAGNRKFFADHYAALLLLYFFNPVLTSRNALLQASQLAKVQAFCGGRPVSAGSCQATFLSPAQRQSELSIVLGPCHALTTIRFPDPAQLPSGR